MVYRLVKDSFRKIWKHRMLFLVLFFTQLVFFGLIGYAGVHYYVETMDNAASMLEQFENLSEEQISSMQLPEPYTFYENYQGMIYNLLMGVVVMYLVFLIFEGINWNLTNVIVNKARHLKEMLWYQLKYAALFLIFTIPLLLIVLGLVKSISMLGSNTQFVIGTFAFGLIDAYFLSIALGICHKYRMRELLKILKRTFVLGYTKAGALVPVGLVIFIAFAAAGALLYYSTFSFIALALSAVLFILIVNFGRVYCMAAVKDAQKSKDFWHR